MMTTAHRPSPRVEVYQDRSGRWRYRKIARNGRNTQNPGQHFASKWNAKRSARREHPDLPLIAV